MEVQEYIATFHTHFGASQFARALKADGIRHRMMPVPRALSSSCGTCVRYEYGGSCPAGDWPEEMEQAVAVTEGGYQTLWRAEQS